MSDAERELLLFMCDCMRFLLRTSEWSDAAWMVESLDKLMRDAQQHADLAESSVA